MAQLKDLLVNGDARVLGTLYAENIDGAITKITAGEGLSGGGTSGDVELELDASGVTAGTYGSTTLIPKITVDAYGRVTAVSTSTAAVSKVGTDTVGSTTQPIYLNAGTPTKISYTIATSVPSGAVFTDTKVTAVGNHYTPTKSKTISASSTTAATWGSTDLVTGIEMDAAGHVTGVTSIQMPAAYSAGTGITLSGTTFSNSGVRSIATGSTNGTISVNTNGTTANVAVKGLGSNAYTSTSYLPLAGGTVTGNVTFNAGASSQKSEPKLIWKTVGSNTPYIGYAEDQSDGTFVICSMENNVTTPRHYTNGLAIGGGSGNLFWKGVKIATISDIPTLSASGNAPLNLSASGHAITGSVSTAGANTLGVVKGFHRTSGTATGTKTTDATNAPAVQARTTTSGRYYGVETDTTGAMFVNVPWTNTTYSAGTGLSLSGTTFNHSNSITAGTAQGSATATLTFGGTFTIPTITYDAQGHITGKGTTTMTMPANPNVDTKVTQAYDATTNDSIPLLFSATSGITSTASRGATTAKLNNKFYVNPSTGGLYATSVYGAVWNDYAEYRNQIEEIKPGYCVASGDDGKVYKTTEKFQACDGIVSDTFGFGIGETDECKTPLAVAGRVLAYAETPEELHSGDTVCAGPNGKVVKMTREEIREWPDRILGIVSEIPTYETWGTGNVKVDGRIWIKVK